MKISWMSRARSLLFPPADLDHGKVDRYLYERFAIPYSFKPRLSVGEAFIAAILAFFRIFLGSLAFALWGTYVLLAWSAIRNFPLRLVAVLALTVLFITLLLLLMLGISTLARILAPRRH